MLPASPVVVIPPGIDTNRFRPVARSGARAALGFRDDWQVIGTLGRLVEVKGQRYLIEALATLPATTHVALIGDGPERMALERLAREAGVASRVHFLGLRSDPENILPAFDVFCLPSLNEGLPRAVLEAQACGIPVVASDVGALRQAIADGGRVVPPKDTAALAAALAELLAAPPPVPATRGHIVDRFSLHATVAALRPLVARPS
jgi:glycosyltransferase involved in cell wall biosynthesis